VLSALAHWANREQAAIIDYHSERNHQGLANRLIESELERDNGTSKVVCESRLGGLLNHYRRAACTSSEFWDTTGMPHENWTIRVSGYYALRRLEGPVVSRNSITPESSDNQFVRDRPGSPIRFALRV
jgi:hypothetical protein